MLSLLFLLLQPGPPGGTVAPFERQVLLQLFEATGGPSWTNREGWAGPPGTECAWAGIECRPADTDPLVFQVHSIDLSRNGLTGYLPASLAQLPGLVRLSIVGNALAGPPPEPVLQRWERGLLEIRSDAPLTDITEVKLVVSTNVYCANEVLVIKSDGSVAQYREFCRKPRSADPKPYCELRQGKTREFSHLTRYLASSGFFSSHTRPLNKGVWVDVPIVTVTTTGPFGVKHSVEVAPNGDDSLQVWSYEKTIRGTIADIEWEKPQTIPECPTQ